MDTGYTCVDRAWDSGCFQGAQSQVYSQPPSRSKEMDFSNMEQEALLQGEVFMV